MALDDVGIGSSRSILRSRFRSYDHVYLSTVGRLRERGFDLLPTFLRLHFSVLLPGLDHAEELFDALGELQRNPYAGGQETGGQR